MALMPGICLADLDLQERTVSIEGEYDIMIAHPVCRQQFTVVADSERCGIDGGTLMSLCLDGLNKELKPSVPSYHKRPHAENALPS